MEFTINAIEAKLVEKFFHTVREPESTCIAAGDGWEVGAPLAAASNRKDDTKVGIGLFQLDQRGHATLNSIHRNLCVCILVAEL